jgi:hypothetical protein
VYHHPAWLRSLSAEYDRKIVMLACESQGGHLLGMFPLIRTRGLLLPVGGALTKARLSSLPRTPIGGPLSTSQEALRLLLRAAMDRVSQQPGVRLQIKTEGPVLDGLIDGFSGLPWRKSFVVSLPEDGAQLFIRDHSVRKNVKRAKNSGLQVRMVSSEDDLYNWYTLYLRTMRRVVVPPRPFRFFQALWKYMMPLGLMITIFAERHSEGRAELIAGLISFMHNKRVSAGFLASPAEHFYLRPNDLIHWEGIQWATRNGFREYDFGEVPEGDVQLTRFKTKWWAEKRQLYHYYYPQIAPRGAHSSVLSSYQNLLGGIWRRIPLRITAHLGDLIYRYL